MREREMEDLIASNPNHFFPRNGFVLRGRQQPFQGVGRFDLLFVDRHGMNILMELKATPARYDVIDQLVRYRDALTAGGATNVLMWVVAPSIAPTMKEFLTHLGIEFTEIHELEFKRAAEVFGYKLRDLTDGGPKPPLSPGRSSTQGLAAIAAVKRAGKWGFIDLEGKFVIPASFGYVGDFGEGIASASANENCGKFGYIDLLGQFVIDPQFDEAGTFEEGQAIARIFDEDREEFEWGYVDRGTLKYTREDWCDNHQDVRFEDILEIDACKKETSEGLRPVCYGSYYGYQNVKGGWEIEPKFEMAGRFSEGLAAVRINGQYGVIDRLQNLVVEPQYEDIQAYSDGLAAYRSRNKWGFIDHMGNPAIKATFEEYAWGFDQGVACVGRAKRLGAISKSGKFVIEPRFRNIDQFKFGLARAQDSNGKWGFINGQGEMTIPANFDEVRSFHAPGDPC